MGGQGGVGQEGGINPSSMVNLPPVSTDRSVFSGFLRLPRLWCAFDDCQQCFVVKAVFFSFGRVWTARALSTSWVFCFFATADAFHSRRSQKGPDMSACLRRSDSLPAEASRGGRRWSWRLLNGHRFVFSSAFIGTKNFLSAVPALLVTSQRAGWIFLNEIERVVGTDFC